MTKAALPHLRRGHSGSVVFVSSVNALLGGFSEVSYSVSKAGLHALDRCLTADNAADGVRFNVVVLGSIIGTWRCGSDSKPDTPERSIVSPTSIRVTATANPKTRPSQYCLASERSAWISGVVLPVDGGLTATGALPGGRWWESP